MATGNIYTIYVVEAWWESRIDPDKMSKKLLLQNKGPYKSKGCIYLHELDTWLIQLANWDLEDSVS